MVYEVLLEIGVSKEIIRVTKENLEGTVKSKLSCAVCGGPYLRPYDCVPKTKTHISFRDGQLNGIHLLISIRMMTLKMEINSEYQNVKTSSG